MWTSRIIYTATPEKGVTNVIFSANEVDPALKGISSADVDEFYYEGNWTDVCSAYDFRCALLTLLDPFLDYLSSKIRQVQDLPSFVLYSRRPSRFVGRFLEYSLELQGLGRPGIRGGCSEPNW